MTLTLEEFEQLPASEQREAFDRLSFKDQFAYVDAADPLAMLMGGYPSLEEIERRMKNFLMPENGGSKYEH